MIEVNLRSRLSPRLFEHSRQVAAYAEHLARIHGVDPDWTFVAGLYHDLGKSVELSVMREVAEAEGIAFDEPESQSKSLLHSAASAAYFRRECSPPDPFVRAVRGHTTGGAPFGREEQILYVADFAEPTRPFQECASVRMTAERDLRLATFEAVTFKLRFLMLRNKIIHPKSIMLYNFLVDSSGAPPQAEEEKA